MHSTTRDYSTTNKVPKGLEEIGSGMNIGREVDGRSDTHQIARTSVGIAI